MAKILSFPGKKTWHSAEVKKLKEVSDKIDSIVLAALVDNTIEYKEILALMAHRLGTLLSHTDDKKKLWKVCESIAHEQAGLKKKK